MTTATTTSATIFSPTTIALADDHKMFREALSVMVNSWMGTEVVWNANNGNELIAMLSQKVCDIVLLDLNMPDLNGFETLDIIKSRFKSVAVIGLSTYKSEELLYHLVQLGADGYVNKADDISILKHAINEVVKGNSYYSGASISKLLKYTDRHHSRNGNNLTKSEFLFLKGICSDKTYKEISDDMGIAERHAEYLRTNLFERFNVKSRTGLALTVIQRGLIC